MNGGVLALKDIPADFPLTRRQAIQVNSTRRRRAHVDRAALRSFLELLHYPLYYLDFETIGTPIPLYDASRPYEQVPFQYSVHVQRRPGGKLRHFSFLPKTKNDPRRRILELLQRRLGDSGSIVAYNASFEMLRLRQSAARYPEFVDWVDSILPRFVDLWRPFCSLHYYHPRQEGRTGLKSVLPALVGVGYDDLEIGDGETAYLTFMELVFGRMPREEKDATREALLRYCGRDTEGMVQIVDRLRALAG